LISRIAPFRSSAVPHGRYPIEAGPCGDFLGPEFLAAPRADDDVGHPLDDLWSGLGTLLRGFAGGPIGGFLGQWNDALGEAWCDVQTLLFRSGSASRNVRQSKPPSARIEAVRQEMRSRLSNNKCGLENPPTT
jgi:hypothetical protein